LTPNFIRIPYTVYEIFHSFKLLSPISVADKTYFLAAVICDTVQCAVIGCKLKQNAIEGCNSCASLAGLVLSFIACFILLVIAPL